MKTKGIIKSSVLMIAAQFAKALLDADELEKIKLEKERLAFYRRASFIAWNSKKKGPNVVDLSDDKVGGSHKKKGNPKGVEIQLRDNTLAQKFVISGISELEFCDKEYSFYCLSDQSMLDYVAGTMLLEDRIAVDILIKRSPLIEMDVQEIRTMYEYFGRDKYRTKHRLDELTKLSKGKSIGLPNDFFSRYEK